MFHTVWAFFNQSWFYYTLIGLYAATVLIILGVILSENRNPVKSLAWVTVLLLLPVAGVVLYLFFGRSIKNTRMISRRARRKLRRSSGWRGITANDQQARDLSMGSRQQLALGHSLASANYHAGNNVTVYTNGTSKFSALEQDLRNARHYINLQYYIFEDDNIGTTIRDILIERAQAGVKVRVIYDHVGSLHTKKRFFAEMQRAGIEVHPFFKVTFPPFGARINWRNHRKLCIIDGRIAYVGGMNIADRYIDGGKKFDSWRDSHVRVAGPAVAALQYSFAVDWNFMGQQLIADDITPSLTPQGDDGAMLVTSGPTSQWSNIELIMHHAISSATKRVFLQTPYFLPTEGLLKSLQTAALSGVDVRVMLPARGDSMLLRHASFSYITECLRSGIKIYLYNAGMLHAKTMVVDHEMATVGSANFDFRSFEHNFEANLFVYSKQFNERMADIFVSDMRNCTRVMPAGWRKRPWSARVAESVLRPMAPIL